MAQFNRNKSIKEVSNKIKNLEKSSETCVDAMAGNFALELVRHSEKILHQLHKSPLSKKIEQIQEKAAQLAQTKNPRNFKDKLLPIWSNLLAALEKESQKTKHKHNNLKLN